MSQSVPLGATSWRGAGGTYHDDKDEMVPGDGRRERASGCGRQCTYRRLRNGQAIE